MQCLLCLICLKIYTLNTNLGLFLIIFHLGMDFYFKGTCGRWKGAGRPQVERADGASARGGLQAVPPTGTGVRGPPNVAKRMNVGITQPVTKSWRTRAKLELKNGCSVFIMPGHKPHKHQRDSIQ